MKQIQKLFKLFTFVIAMVAFGSIEAYGSSSKTYYAKAVATAVGNGKVYVGNSNTAPNDAVYSENAEGSNSASSTSSSTNVDFYLFAEPSDATTKFDGWYDNAECTGTALSTANPYNVKISSNSTNQSSPVTKTYYAKFVEATEFYSSTIMVSCVGDGGSVAVSTESTNEDFGAEKSASNLNDVEADHTYYLQAKVTDEENYRFLGWYSDEACTNQISKNANYTYKVTAESTDQAAPSQFHAYAKFEMIIAFTCSKARLYFNVGDEAAANDGVTCKNTTITGYTSSNTAVATVAADGKVTPVAVGSTKITVSAEGVDDVTYVATVLDYSEAGKTQIGNGDFEDWSSVADNNHAPKNWNSFETNEGTWASTARAQQIAMKEDHRPGSNGLFCVDIYSRSVIGVVAQGNLTLGCINAGSTSAANAANHNFSKITDPNKSETIDRIPTAVKVWVKFVPAKTNADYPYARVAATIHDAHNYITQGDAKNDTEANKAYAVAQAEKNFEACEWTELILPFELTKNAVVDGQLYIIFNASTNASPGKGQSGDHLFIDDVELVYDTDYDKVPVTVSDAKYATFVAPFDVKMPAAITASTVETVGEKYDTMLDLTAVGNNLVPANTPVILSSEDAQDRVAYGVAAPATAEAGLLIGVYEDTEAPVGSYVLQSHEGVVGMYQVEAGTQPTVGAGRAYLNVPAGSDIKAFFFDSENATAISSIQQEKQNDAIYNLAGQRTNRMQKGINIVNGKKIAVK